MKILVTGMSGLIGKAIRKELEGDYELRALNRSPVEGVECVQADISDFDAIRPAFDGIDQVVHMAAIAHGSPEWDDLLPFNVIGTYNVFEAARQAGVSRVIAASSGATISGYESVEPYKALGEGRYDDVDQWDDLTHESPLHPKGIYGCTKVWAEALARHYSDSANMSMICLRIGAVNAEDKPLETRQKSVWCSQGDVARMVRSCIEAPDGVKCDTFFVVSNNKYSYRDMKHPKEVLGFEPQDSADDFPEP
jgi:nucleoside-diphosphate-sugar epimerase